MVDEEFIDVEVFSLFQFVDIDLELEFETFLEFSESGLIGLVELIQFLSESFELGVQDVGVFGLLLLDIFNIRVVDIFDILLGVLLLLFHLLNSLIVVGIFLVPRFLSFFFDFLIDFFLLVLEVLDFLEVNFDFNSVRLLFFFLVSFEVFNLNF